MPLRSLRSIRAAPLLSTAASLLFVLPALAQDGEPRPMAAVPGGPAGSEVFISMASGRVAPSASMGLSFGGLSGGYEGVGRMTAGPDGVMAGTVTVPAWAERNLVYYFFMNLGGGVRIFSDPFIVTGPGGELTLSGAVTEVAGGCVLMTQLDGTGYALSGVSASVRTGSRITVEGILGTMPAADPANSPCAGRPGIPVRVHVTRVG